MKRLVCGVLLLGMGAVGWGQATVVSSLLQPALRGVGQTVTGLQPERWKLSGPMKTTAAADIGSIQRDLDGTLPGLLHAADAAPESLTAILPVTGNVDALYDVLLRVAEKAQMGAPGEQTAALGQALQGLEDARKALNGRLATLAANEERQMHDLRQNVAAQTAAARAASVQVTTLQAAQQAAKPAPCVPARTTRRRTAVKKPTAAAKSATTPATTPAKP